MEARASTAPPPFPDRLVITVPPPLRTTTSSVIVKPPGDLAPTRRVHCKSPVAFTDVFVDDEIQVAQGSTARLNRYRRVLLHCNDFVFWPNDAVNANTNRKQPMSNSKFDKGDTSWATTKITLGWLIDTLQKTIELPAHRKERLLLILENARKRRCMGT
jgi:hypothetical protein